MNGVLVTPTLTDCDGIVFACCAGSCKLMGNVEKIIVCADIYAFLWFVQVHDPWKITRIPTRTISCQLIQKIMYVIYLCLNE